MVVALMAATLVSLSAADYGPAHAEWTDYRGFRAIHIGNGIVDLHVVPDIGGRILQARCRGYDYLFVNDDLAGRVMPQVDDRGKPLPWNNYGGDKLWVAPQGGDDGSHWFGPPDPVLDGCRYEAEILAARGDEARVRLTSSGSPGKYGVQLIREITLRAGESRVTSRTTMRNVSDKEVRWAIWEVTQHDARSDRPPYYDDSLAAYVPASEGSRHPRGFTIMAGHQLNPAWQRPERDAPIRVRFNYEVGKIGVDSDAGWLAVMRGRAGMSFTESFAYSRSADYTDDGSSVEFWINGRERLISGGTRVVSPDDRRLTPPFMESEVLSPYVALAPGEDYSFEVVWGLGAARGEPVAVSAQGLVTSPAAAHRAGDMVHVRAAVTPYIAARLAVVLLGPGERETARRVLSVAIPGVPKALAVSMRDSLAEQARLVLLDERGEVLGELATLAVR